jgi:hypothetical protein
MDAKNTKTRDIILFVAIGLLIVLALIPAKETTQTGKGAETCAGRSGDTF